MVTVYIIQIFNRVILPYLVWSSANNSVSFNTTVQNALTLDASGRLLVTAASGLGYGTGAGGTNTRQVTAKTDAVTINKPAGRILMNGAALGAGVAVEFIFNNSVIVADDSIIFSIQG